MDALWWWMFPMPWRAFSYKSLVNKLPSSFPSLSKIAMDCGVPTTWAITFQSSHYGKYLKLNIPENGFEESWLWQIVNTYPILEELCLHDCPKLVSFPTCELSAPKLQSFSIENWSYQESLPKSMQTQLPTIHSLGFRNCPYLESLQLRNCTQLDLFHMNGGLPSTLDSL